MNTSHLGAAILKSLAVALGSLLVTLVIFQGVARPMIWRIPEAYEGWVLVQYGDAACPPMATEGIFEVLTVGRDGRTCTASGIRRGWHYVRYEYVDAGRTREIDLARISHGSVNWDRQRETFFVGQRDRADPGSLPFEWR